MPLTNPHGQILIPGLAVFLGLLLLLFAFIAYSKRSLEQTRMEMAAQAAALSAARAEAQILNNAASHNLALNAFVPVVYIDWNLGVTELPLKDGVDVWYQKERLTSVLQGMKGYPVGVGNKVARLNGATKVQHWPPIIESHLLTRDLKVEFIDVYIPTPIIQDYDDIFYVRAWRPDQRRAQPPHQMSWLCGRGGSAAMGSAHLYLDVRPGEGHNGGFPRTSQKVWEDFTVLPFYPQFNARLVSPPALSKIWNLFNGN